jgi:hypothetical protein
MLMDPIGYVRPYATLPATVGRIIDLIHQIGTVLVVADPSGGIFALGMRDERHKVLMDHYTTWVVGVFSKSAAYRDVAESIVLTHQQHSDTLKKGAVPPPGRKRWSRLDPYATELIALLAEQGRGVKLTVRAMHVILVRQGFAGSYGEVAAFVRRWRAGPYR